MAIHGLFNCLANITTFLIALLFSRIAAQVGTVTQDISTLQDFSLQQQCAQTCFQLNIEFCPMDMLGVALGCASMSCATKSWQAKNDCYCRLDFQQPAQDYLDECIQQSCTVGDPSVAAGSAGSIYRRYCEEKGYDTTAPASNEASTTSLARATSSTRSRAIPTATISTEDGSATTSNNARGGLSTAALVGIILGAVIGIALVVGLVWCCRRRMRTPLPPPPPTPPTPYVYPLSTDNVNRLHGLEDLRVGDSVSNLGSQAPPPMLLPPRPLAPPMSMQSGSTGMAQPYGHMGMR